MDNSVMLDYLAVTIKGLAQMMSLRKSSFFLKTSLSSMNGV